MTEEGEGWFGGAQGREGILADTGGQIVTLPRRSGRRDGSCAGVVRRGSGEPTPRCCLEVVDHSVGCIPGR